MRMLLGKMFSPLKTFFEAAGGPPASVADQKYCVKMADIFEKLEKAGGKSRLQPKKIVFMGLNIYLLSISIISAAFISGASAQDLATEHTQILNNIELITENLRQLQSLYNQIEMIKNQVEGLKSVATYQNDFSDTDSLRNTLTNLINEGISLSDQTEGLLTNMQQEARFLTASGTMGDQENSLGQGTMNIVQNALNRVRQQRESYQQETNAVNALMARNNQAVGQTQALQTLNELMAQTIPQMQLTRELLSEQIAIQAAMINKESLEKQDMTDKMDQIIHSIDNSNSSFDLGH